jgi:hypothetical protein
MIRFLLDEMYSPEIAAIVRRSGLDIISIHEGEREGTPDLSVLMFAAMDERCVITENHRHFVPLTAAMFEQRLPHAGVLLVPPPNNRYAPIAAAIVRFARENPDGLQPYEIRWLAVGRGRD